MKNYHTQEIPHVSSVELRVLNLNRSIEFYTKTIGMKLIHKTDNSAKLGTSNQTLLVLHQIENDFVFFGCPRLSFYLSRTVKRILAKIRSFMENLTDLSPNLGILI